MSATFKLANQKKQDELRRMMAQHKEKVKKPATINNPLAKYNDAGQLMCILCKSVVRSEAVWNIHINAKQHKDNVAEAKRLKELTQNFTTTVKKRPASPPLVPQKKIKGILKNSAAQSLFSITTKKNPSVPNVITYHNEEIKRAALKPLEELAKQTEIAASSSTKVSSTSNCKEVESKQISDAPIPEGFFDDPKLDAKARNIEYKDPVEEEWEKFQKEIKEEATASAELIAGEQEEATAERQIDEIDEQIRNWSRVLDLERKKEKTRLLNEEKAQKAIENDKNDSESDDDIDEFLNWRSKKSFR